jgi:cytochrome c biogenesis protein CcmG/thiol:disulfide interchange protein DsbE
MTAAMIMPESRSASGIQQPERRHFAIAIPLLVFSGLVVLLAIGLTRNPREVPSPLIEQLRR